MLKCFAPELVEVHGPFIQLDTLIAGAFDFLFAPDIHVNPGSLRAHKTTPHTACKCGNKKQGESSDDKYVREQGEVLRPKSQAENGKPLLHDIEKNSLMAVIADPGDHGE